MSIALQSKKSQFLLFGPSTAPEAAKALNFFQAYDDEDKKAKIHDWFGILNGEPSEFLNFIAKSK